MSIRDLLRSFIKLAEIALLAGLCRGESLEKAWEIALAANHGLQSTRKQTSAAEETLASVKTNWLPKVSSTISGTFLSTTPESIVSLPGISFVIPVADNRFVISSTQVSVPLYTAGRIHNGILSATEVVEASRNTESFTVLDVKLSVAEAYIGVLRSQRLVEVAHSAVADLTGHATDVNNLFEQALVARNDVLAVEVTLADARQNELQARNRLDIAQAAYNRLLGRPLTDAVSIDEISPQPLVETIEQLQQEAASSRAELTGLSHQAEALRRQASSVRAEMRPQIGFSGGYTFLQNPLLTHENFWSATFGLQWNVFDFGEKGHQAKALAQQAESALEQRSEAASVISLQVRKAWLDAVETRKRIEVAEKALAQADENLRVAQDRYREGVGSNTEVLDAEALRTRIYGAHANALYDAVWATMQLRRAAGTL
jgi:outer membrane protein